MQVRKRSAGGSSIETLAVPIAMNGQIVDGLKAAANLVELQKPLLRDFFPEIDHCKSGTINIQLDHALDIRIPDIVTPPIRWQPDSALGERFGFTRISLEFLHGRHGAWIYGAEFSSHRFNYMMVEVLARPIEGIAPGLPCTLHLDRFTGYIVV
jgi:hypothetical protein